MLGNELGRGANGRVETLCPVKCQKELGVGTSKVVQQGGNQGEKSGGVLGKGGRVKNKHQVGRVKKAPLTGRMRVLGKRGWV